jgi:uncharacterized protein YndB with AHSA1/START domain
VSSVEPEVRSVVIEREIAHPPDRVWRALTQPHLIEAWLMRNDFKPVAGHRFQLSRNPSPEVSVVIDCEVLDVQPQKALSYSWTAYGVETIVTFRLTPTARGTLLRLEQTGFPAHHRQAYKGARASWPHFLTNLENVLSRIE